MERETTVAQVSVTVIDREGQARNIAANTGDVLMQVLRDNVDLTLGTCGGAISCGTCLVRLSPQWLTAIPEPDEDEAEMLEALGADGNSRLSCQLKFDAAADGMQAEIAPTD